MSGCWNQFFLIFLSVNQWKGKVLAGPFGLEHLVLILLFWQALALCMEETLCTSAPVHSPAMGCTLGCTPWLDSPWEKHPLFHSELKFPLISLRYSYCAFFLQCHNVSPWVRTHSLVCLTPTNGSSGYCSLQLLTKSSVGVRVKWPGHHTDGQCRAVGTFSPLRIINSRDQ